MNDHSGRSSRFNGKLMKRLIYIVLLLVAWTPYVSGTHILGGDISYESVTNSSYKFFVNVYRDCNECQIAGRGGGSSTKDCGTFNLYLRSSNRNSCSVQELKTFTPIYESHRKVLPVCSAVKTRCEGSSNFPFGVEVHTYSVIIDFDSFSSFKDCGFELYVKTASRSDALDNIQEKEAIFFNYVYIDPIIQHNSPRFEPNPDFLLDANSSLDHRVLSNWNSDDSLDVHLSQPLRAKDKPLTYKSGFNVNRPISVYCSAIPDCPVNKSSKPPSGYYVNSSSGQIVFRPIRSGEQAVVVYEVEQWVNTSSGRRLAGIIRRDIHQVVQTSTNNPPEMTSDTSKGDVKSYEVCVGDTLCFNVFAKDLVSRLPDGTKAAKDSVFFKWEFESSSALVSQKSYSEAPYNYVNFCWSPSKSDARSKEYELKLRVIDNHCPLNAYSYKTYLVKVNPMPLIDIVTRPLECGNIDVNIRHRGADRLVNTVWSVKNNDGMVVGGGTSSKDTIQVKEAGSYGFEIYARNEFRCLNVSQSNIEISALNVSGPDIKILGEMNFCDGDTAYWKIDGLKEYSLDSVHWTIDGIQFARGKEIVQRINSGLNAKKLELTVFSKVHEVVKCISEVDTSLVVDFIPFVGIDPIPDFCPGDGPIDLMAAVRPKGGTFVANPFLTQGSLLEKQSLIDPAKSVEYCFEYEVSSRRNLCTTKKPLCVTNLPEINLKLKDLTVCSFSGRFLLNNHIEQPYSFQDVDVKWYLNRVQKNILNEANQFWLDISSVSTGRHEIICVMINESGCESRDTAFLELLNQVNIQSVQAPEICQGEDLNLNDLFKVSPKSGVWNSFTHFDNLRDAILGKEACGDSIKLTYTYDQFGCYDKLEVNLRVVCRPDIQIFLEDTVCSDQQTVLNATPIEGEWTGSGIQNGILSTFNTSGNNSVEYQVNRSNCSFIEKEDYFVQTKARIDLPKIPPFLCRAENLILNKVSINGGDLNLNLNGRGYVFNESATEIKLVQDESLESWSISGVLTTYSANCPVYINWDIPVKPNPEINLVEEDFNGCESLKIEPTWNPSNQISDWSLIDFEWDFGDHLNPEFNTSHNPNHIYTEDGTYMIRVKTQSPFGCTWNSNPVPVYVYDKPSAYFTMSSGDYLSVKNTLVEFTNASDCADPMKYLWDFDTRTGLRYSQDESPVFVFPKDTGDYTITLHATSEQGCEDLYQRTMKIGPDIMILVPSGFSPNKRGPKSTEFHSVLGFNVKDYEIWILSRNGDVVYHSNNLDSKWDGSFKGAPCQAGVYAYKVIAKSLTDEEYKIGGTITLIR